VSFDAPSASRCTTGISREIPFVVFPSSRAEIIRVLELARGSSLPIYPVSTGRNWGYGSGNPVVDGCIVLNLSRLNRILDVDADLGLLTLEPGVTQRQLADYLKENSLPYMVPTTGAGPTASIVGNALERGFGITPLTDHFLSVVGLEAILADGSVYRSPLPGLGGTSAHPFKWGIGPYVDGLFAQGSFGIVTSMTVALARRPEVVAVFLCGIKQEDSFASLVSAIGEAVARLPGVVGGVNLMNARRVFAMSAPYPTEHSPSDGVIPDSLLQGICRRRGIRPWNVFGTLFGTRRIVQAAKSEIRSTIGEVGSRLVFLTPGIVEKVQSIARRVPGLRSHFGQTLDTLRSSMDLVSGEPNETALPLAYWRSRPSTRPGALDPAQDQTGLIWYAPLVEMRGEHVASFVRFVTETMSAHGREPLITLTSLSERCFASTVPVLFDHKSTAERNAAWQCYDQLLHEGVKRGFLPYRIGIQSMGWLVEQSPAYWSVISALKGALDPKDLIAPGRYAPVLARDR
jgi:hypothetical protein